MLWDTPGSDIAFWFNNLEASLEELNKIKENDSSQLEKTNVLMKLRETILDHESKGDIVTAPHDMRLFPYNTSFFIAYIVSFIILLVGCLVFVVLVDD